MAKVKQVEFHYNGKYEPEGVDLYMVIPTEKVHGAFNIDHKKLNSFHSSFALIDTRTGLDIALIRYYYPGTRVYCCVWLTLPERFGIPALNLNGSGYVRTCDFEGALWDALTKMGFQRPELTVRGTSTLNTADMHADKFLEILAAAYGQLLPGDKRYRSKDYLLMPTALIAKANA